MKKNIVWYFLPMVLMVAVLFFSVINDDKGIFKDQAYEFHYQAGAYLQSELDQGNFPQWNRRQAMGAPFVSYPEFSLFYPLFIPAVLIFGPYGAVQILILLQYLFIAFFTAAFARRIGYSHTAALITAGTFTFSGYLLLLYSEFQSLGAIAALPAALYFFEAYKTSRRISAILAAGLFLGIGHLAGGTQYSYYVDLLFLLWAFGPSAEKMKILPRLQQNVLPAIAALSISLLVGGVVLFPAAKLAGLTLRAQTKFEQAAHSPKGDKERGFEIGARDIPGFVYPMEPEASLPNTKPVHPGAAALILAVIGAVFGTGPRRFWLFGLATVFLLLAAGRHTPLFHLFYSLPIPGIGMFKNPVRMVVPAIFCISLLAGIGVDGLNSDRLMRIPTLILTIIFSLLILLLSLRQGAFYFGTLLIFASMLTLATAVYLGIRFGRVPETPIIIAVFLCMLAGYPVLDLLPKSQIEKRIQESDLAKVIKEGRPGRVFALDPTPTFEYYNTSDLVQNTGMARGVDLIDGNSSLHLARYLQFTAAGDELDPIRQYALPGFTEFANLRAMAAMAYAIAPEANKLTWPDAKPIAQRNGNILYGLKPPAFARMMQSWECAENAEDAGHKMFLLRQRETLADVVEGPGCTAGTGDSRPAIYRRINSDRIEVDLPDNAQGYLFVSESFAPGWAAQVDGQQRDIVPADIAFMALWIKRGESKVVLTYRAPGFALWAAISGIVSFLCLLGVGMGYWRGKNQGATRTKSAAKNMK